MKFDNRARPLTRGQLDIWSAQETGHSGKEWQLADDRTILQRCEDSFISWPPSRLIMH